MFQLAQALLKPGPGELEAPRQLSGRHPGVILQVSQQTPVEVVKPGLGARPPDTRLVTDSSIGVSG